MHGWRGSFECCPRTTKKDVTVTLRSARTLISVALLTTAAAVAHATVTPPFTGVYVFGDSLSDAGNNYLTALPAGYPTTASVPSAAFTPTLPYTSSGSYLPTFSNGPVWVPTFAAGLGLASFGAASLAGGGDYAHGGARMTVEGASGPGLPANFPFSLATQLNTYLGSQTVSPTALYVVAGGGNDVRATGAQVAGGAPLVSTTLAAAADFATAAATMVGTLKSLGANNIVVWNVPDVGKAPGIGDGGVGGVGQDAAAASFIANTFNSYLNGALAGSGAQIFDVFGLINNIVANPVTTDWNFGNVTLSCGFAGNACDASSALFWDGIHPTAYAHTVLGQQMLAAVPEPGSMLLMALGIAGLLVARRRAR